MVGADGACCAVQGAPACGLPRACLIYRAVRGWCAQALVREAPSRLTADYGAAAVQNDSGLETPAAALHTARAYGGRKLVYVHAADRHLQGTHKGSPPTLPPQSKQCARAQGLLSIQAHLSEQHMQGMRCWQLLTIRAMLA
jgi:hypothetical protein